MRRISLLIALVVMLTPAFALDVGDEPVVSVRVGELKSGPGFLARTIAELDYGESVEVVEVRPDWVKVRVAGTGAEGWLHDTAVAGTREMRMDLSGNRSATTASTREIALAGRGFNEQVEARYKGEKGLDFALVDELEGYGRPVEDLAAFLDDGGLMVDEGGAE